MTKIPSDQPAFPHLMQHCQIANETEWNAGITMRDYFAAAALTGLLSRSDISLADACEGANIAAQVMLNARITA